MVLEIGKDLLLDVLINSHVYLSTHVLGDTEAYNGMFLIMRAIRVLGPP